VASDASEVDDVARGKLLNTALRMSAYMYTRWMGWKMEILSQYKYVMTRGRKYEIRRTKYDGAVSAEVAVEIRAVLGASS